MSESGQAERVHDEELDTGEPVLRALFAAELPDLVVDVVERLPESGTDNALWRVRSASGGTFVARLPRRADDVSVRVEAETLARVGRLDLAGVATPHVVHVGRGCAAYPYAWLLLEWLDGPDLWQARSAVGAPGAMGLAEDLGRFVVVLRSCEPWSGLAERRSGRRGGLIEPIVAAIHRWLDDPRWRAGDLLDVAAVRRLADLSLEVADRGVERGVVHGDLLPGNLLVGESRSAVRLGAVIDWGACGLADLAQDLAPAWSVFDREARSAFREVVGADEAAWRRGRLFELEHAVSAVLYYRPRGHPLADVMARTLERVLDDPI